MKYIGKIFNFLTHRAVLGIILLLSQVLILITMVWHFNVQFVYFYLISYLLGILVSLYIINKTTNPGYKIAWIMVILVFPVIGIVIYALFGGVQLSSREKKKMEEIYYHQLKNISKDETAKDELKYENITAYNQAMYITKYSLSPICKNTETKYFKIGEEYYEKLLEELKKAKRYIFMEFFIVSEGKMWDSILEILKQKVKEGIEVRFIYDDLGCIMTLPNHYYNKLEEYGIKACTFNRFVPILRSKFNNRDHRKIVIIDGYIAFTGGINLADEYINEIEKYGHWKDNGIMLKGEAVWNMTIMFMSMWDFVRGSKYSYKNYRPLKENLENIKSDGFIIPYCDNPWDHEPTGETIYLNLINKANRYIYITTPYLIIDNEMVTALQVAAKSGLDVKIITPSIPDKKMINEVTKAYYDELIKNGVQIYEYLPGFIHAKTFIVDDEYATVGTVNLDYRSLYLHFENGVWLYKASTIKSIKQDFLETLEKSKQIHLDKKKKESKLQKLKKHILMAFAPLM